MAVDRETLVEVAISLLAVGGFIVAVVLVGLLFGEDGFSDTGAMALLALIVGFVLVMSAAGYWLSGREA